MKGLRQTGECQWTMDPTGPMRAPVLLIASPEILAGLEPEALKQIMNVAGLPGVVGPVVAMPDAHSGYGFPIGGVAAFDPKAGGVVSAGGVGYDIGCGVRTLHTGLTREDILAEQENLGDELFVATPSGVGAGGSLRLSQEDIEVMLEGGAQWAVDRGLGTRADLARMEDAGCAPGARPEAVSAEAMARIRDQIGSLGSGNHYLEVQWVAEILDPPAASAFGLALGDALVSIHCGSRGLGHQIATDYMMLMAKDAIKRKLKLPDRELACAPILSDLGQDYLGAMRAGVNCALANRQAITHLCRLAFERILPQAELRLLYDVSHNTCRQEDATGAGRKGRLFVHRKGATRALGPGHPDLVKDLRPVGQPVLVGGSMGTASYILAATEKAQELSFGSAPHGAGRALSRSQAKKRYKGRDVLESLGHQGIYLRCRSLKEVAEEAPGAYKDVDEVVDCAQRAGLVRAVARVLPLIGVKG